LGDFNSYSPEDTGELAPHGDLGYGPVNMTLNETHQHHSVNYNFFDGFRTFNPTEPGYSYPHEPYTARIDFIFLSSFFEGLIINATVGDTTTGSLGSSVDVTLNLSCWKDYLAPEQVQDFSGYMIPEEPMVKIFWSLVESPDLAFYQIYRNGSLLVKTLSTNYSDFDVTLGLTYNYQIYAVDTSGNVGPVSIKLTFVLDSSETSTISSTTSETSSSSQQTTTSSEPSTTPFSSQAISSLILLSLVYLQRRNQQFKK